MELIMLYKLKFKWRPIMKHETYNNGKQLYIKCLDLTLNTRSISRDSAYPMINKGITDIILDLKLIKDIDATGLSWLLGFAKKLSKVGCQLYLTEESTPLTILEFLGVESFILPANDINHKRAI